MTVHLATGPKERPTTGRLARRGRRRVPWWLLLLVFLLIVAVIALAIILAHNNSSSSKAKQDVTVQACNADPGGGKPKASGQIVNKSSKTSNYVVRLKFLDAQGNQVTDGVDGVKGVKPLETVKFDLTGIQKAKGPLTCEVTGVTRTHLPGQ